MAAPVFPFNRTRSPLHSCLFLFSLETGSTDWNRGQRCPSSPTQLARTAVSPVRLRDVDLSAPSVLWVSVVRVALTSAHQFQPLAVSVDVRVVLLSAHQIILVEVTVFRFDESHPSSSTTLHCQISTRHQFIQQRILRNIQALLSKSSSPPSVRIKIACISWKCLVKVSWLFKLLNCC